MSKPSKPKPSTPPAADPKAGRNPGYAEAQPRDGAEARQPDPRKSPDPESGGLDRDPVASPDAADKD